MLIFEKKFLGHSPQTPILATRPHPLGAPALRA